MMRSTGSANERARTGVQLLFPNRIPVARDHTRFADNHRKIDKDRVNLALGVRKN
jgi:hypothetical protein